MEFIHHHLVNICFCSIAQRNIGHDFSSSSDNGRIPVDCGVTCHHANIFRPKNLAQREKFLTHEGLNWSSVERALPPRHSDKCAAFATIDLPEPVGVAKITLSPASSASDASSWAGYKVIPRWAVHETKVSHTASS